mmetsp:Transcript_43017/g.135909  ORF Transcript_43017/g.135909 Transcript_43017/m.135909 type:complete len:92 (-) Transcript_43017:850-1125(-)
MSLGASELQARCASALNEEGIRSVEDWKALEKCPLIASMALLELRQEHLTYVEIAEIYSSFTSAAQDAALLEEEGEGGCQRVCCPRAVCLI